MSEAIPLPPRPNLEHYKKLAKDFQKACKSDAPDAIRQWAANVLERAARHQGVEITPDFAARAAFEAEAIERRWRKAHATRGSAACTLASAQFFVAREHGFASWPKFVAHVTESAQAHSAVFAFEEAADAIAAGNLTKLKKLLKANPQLARARSTREHRSTLLHYVSANGIENFRQKTPPNIVEITRLLLDAGCDVNAVSEAYGGRTTTLGLTATSCHPEDAGVQLPMLELLIERGALIDGPDGSSAVNDCLRNGRGAAAEYLANHGARLDLEGTAGVGRLDVVQSFFKKGGSLEPAVAQKLTDGFLWACQFGRTSVVEFLLAQRPHLSGQRGRQGQTGLHWASYGGHADLVRMLLGKGAPIDAKDELHGGTPLDWALHGWAACANDARLAGFYRVVAALVRAGAHLDEGSPDGVAAAAQRDRGMQAALRGEIADGRRRSRKGDL